MNRKQFLHLNLAGIIGLVSSCEPDSPPKEITIVSSLNITQLIPEIAEAGGSITVSWIAENIAVLAIFISLNGNSWQLVADAVKASDSSFQIGMPSKFNLGDLLSIRLVGNGIESIKNNIPTKYIEEPKVLNIVSIEPAFAVAGRTMKLNFEAKNIQQLLFFFRSNMGEWVEFENPDTGANYLNIQLPAQFEPLEKLSFKIEGDGLEALIENLDTFNKVIIDENSHPDILQPETIFSVVLAADTLWLKRNSANQLLAMSGLCTHASCPISYQTQDKLFHCSCHGSRFDLEGNVLVGPASEPLRKFKTNYLGNNRFEILY